MKSFIIDYLWFVRHSLDRENVLTNKWSRKQVWCFALWNGFGFANDMRKGV